ncbi:hypothetical protein Tco_0137886 [Tanacetum coccineum]
MGRDFLRDIFVLVVEVAFGTIGVVICVLFVREKMERGLDSDELELSRSLGQVSNLNWLALLIREPTKKDGGSRELLFFNSLTSSLLKDGLFGG